jgi:pyruvate/2-oxoacid:ferredoxin oxidoreductase beta subunit/Pyruvate/2-oxoacid:ferredoxin oxidoreductase gamma subunit
VSEISGNTYLDDEMLPYPFCPGCGHGPILEHLNTALVKLQLDPRKIVIITDIGCAGLSDKFFDINALHGLHGRSLTYATGIKLANPDLNVIVLIGDGGCGIGGNHLIHAARRNIGISVLVFNNLNYGMTGGEHSVTTPPGAITATTQYGNLEQPMDICATVGVNGASFVARSTSFEKDLYDLIAAAIKNKGFSLIDIWELCTAHFVPSNRFSKRELERTMDTLSFAKGILYSNQRPEYASAYRQAVADQLGLPPLEPHPMEVKYPHKLNTQLNFVIAGTAGQRVGTAAAAFSRGAVLSGFWVAQHNDYPVTVRSGYSYSEVVLSPGEINYPGYEKPDLLVVLSSEGLERVQGDIAELAQGDTLFINASLLPVETHANKVTLDFKGMGKKRTWSFMSIAEVLRYTQLYPLDAFKEALAMHEDASNETSSVIDSSAGIARFV